MAGDGGEQTGTVPAARTPPPFVGEGVGGGGPSPVREATSFSESIIAEDRGWRSLISGGMRELTFAQIIENLNNATLAYRTNPLAYRLVQLTVDHVLGDGMALSSADARVQAELDLWWNHPLNQLAVRQFDFLTALTLDGELFVTVHQNPYDATSYARLVPAALIDRIETNPDDLEDELRYHQTAQPMTPDTLMRLPSALQAEGRWWDRGQMYHFAVNRPAGVVRGQSDLAPLLPWLKRYRDWLLDRVRLNKYRTAYLWHVQLTGADKRAIIQRQAELAEPPLPGSIIVSNEREVWTAVQPDIKASDVTDDGLAMRLLIAAGAGVPLYWLGEADRTARGTATEMSEPTYRHFRQRQLYFGWLMRTLAVDALKRRGLDVRLEDVEAEFAELDAAVQLQVMQGIQFLTTNLQVAQQSGWIDGDEAGAIFRHYVGEVASLPGRGEPGVERFAKGGRGSRADAETRRRGDAGMAEPGKKARPALDPDDPRAQEPIPPPFLGGGLVAPEPIVRV